jgi:hypothetical protein
MSIITHYNTDCSVTTKPSSFAILSIIPIQIMADHADKPQREKQSYVPVINPINLGGDSTSIAASK